MKKKGRAAVQEFSLALVACIDPPTAVFLQNGDLVGENWGFDEASGRWEGMQEFVVESAAFERACRGQAPAEETVDVRGPGGRRSVLLRCIPLPARLDLVLAVVEMEEDRDDRSALQSSAAELDACLKRFAAGDRVRIARIDPGDPLAGVKRSYNAAVESVDHLLALSGLFAPPR